VTDFHETVFIGGGISCLAAARRWRGDWLLLEREQRPGGMCRSDRIEGFTFDRTGHPLHLSETRTRRWLGQLLAGELLDHLRDSWVHSHGVDTRYPFQAHFYGLPPEVAAECLEGVFAAHYRPPRRRPRPRGAPQAFSEWALERFGPGVARHFLFPYNRKLWTVSPQVLTADWIGRFVPKPDLHQVVLGALCDRGGGEGYNARFRYPRRGGIERLVQALLRGLPARRLRCGTAVRRIDLRRRELRLADGERLRFGRLVSCAPLPALAAMCRPLPDRLRRAARRLRAAAVYNLNLGLRRDDDPRHWVYVPERRFALYRFGFASNFAPHMAPPGCAGIYTEVAFRQGRRPDLAALRRRVLADLQRIGVIRSRRDVLVEHPLLLEPAYAIYDRQRPAAVRGLLGHLERRAVHSIGRWGRWSYGSMEDAILQGLDLADEFN
jgi:protoporphyrinogen oxidase